MSVDPLSHAIIGLSTISLIQPIALNNPTCIGAVIGAVAPDFDIITRIKGDYVYLKHHRVESHSLPGAMAIALLIALPLWFIYKGTILHEIFLGSFIGALSHIIMDLLNSYGVALLYPINKKKYTLNLLMIYDPVVIVLSMYIILMKPSFFLEYVMLFGLFGGYLLIKAYEKKRLKVRLKSHFQEDYIIEEISVMPSTLNPFKWDYIVNARCHYVVGEICSLKGNISLFRSMKKVWNPIVESTLKEELGEYFKSFSPMFHVDIASMERLTVKFTDLRYRIRNDFMHYAYFYYDEDNRLISSEFQPFGLKKRIKI